MGVKEELTEEELAAKEAEEAAKAAELAAKEAEREEKFKKAEEARIRAEAERDALKEAVSRVQAPQSSQWTEQQWEDFTTKTGITKEQAVTHAQIAKQQLDAFAKDFSDKVAKAEEKARLAEERAAKLEAKRGYDAVRSDFFKSRPALSRYDKDVDEFVNRFPESDRNDPAKLKELLGMAETFVKGKVGDKMKSSGGSPRMERGIENHDENESSDVDTSGLEPHQAELVRRLVPSKEKEALLKEYASDERAGIRFSGEKEWGQAKSDHLKQFGKF